MKNEMRTQIKPSPNNCQRVKSQDIGEQKELSISLSLPTLKILIIKK